MTLVDFVARNATARTSSTTFAVAVSEPAAPNAHGGDAILDLFPGTVVDRLTHYHPKMKRSTINTCREPRQRTSARRLSTVI